MNTAYLATLLAVYRTGSMAQAARELNLTHGAVSQQLNALSSRLGIPLVTRAGKTVVLTGAAHRILERAQRILEDVESLPALAHMDEISGEIRIGAGNTSLVSTVPNILTRLIEQFPKLQVSITPGQSAQFYPAVEAGELDAAIALHPPFGISKRLGWTVLAEETFSLIVPVRHARRSALDLLRQEPFIGYSRRSWDGQQIEQYLRAEGIVCKERFELSSTESICLMVDRGLGVAIVPSAWQIWQSRVNVMALPLPGRLLVRSIGLIWSRSNIRQQLIDVFRQAARHEYIRTGAGGVSSVGASIREGLHR